MKLLHLGATQVRGLIPLEREQRSRVYQPGFCIMPSEVMDYLGSALSVLFCSETSWGEFLRGFNLLIYSRER